MRLLPKTVVAFVFLALGAAGGFLTATELTAQTEKPADHSGHDMGNMVMEPVDAKASPSTQAFQAANLKMHKDMSIAFSGNADIDFIKGMIPHHQGAIDMARIVLQYGKDPQTKALAEGIIKAQESEIAMMKDWLAKAGQ